MQNIIKTSRRSLALNEQNFPKIWGIDHFSFDEKQNKIVTKKIDLEPR